MNNFIVVNKNELLNDIIDSVTSGDVQSILNEFLVPIILSAINGAISNLCIVITGTGINS